MTLWADPEWLADPIGEPGWADPHGLLKPAQRIAKMNARRQTKRRRIGWVKKGPDSRSSCLLSLRLLIQEALIFFHGVDWFKRL